MAYERELLTGCSANGLNGQQQRVKQERFKRPAGSRFFTNFSGRRHRPRSTDGYRVCRKRKPRSAAHVTTDRAGAGTRKIPIHSAKNYRLGLKTETVRVRTGTPCIGARYRVGSGPVRYLRSRKRNVKSSRPGPEHPLIMLLLSLYQS